MKLVIIGAVALLLVGGIGAGAYFYFVNPAEAASTPGKEVEKAHEDAKAEKKGDKGDSHGKGGGAYFVQLDPLILPIIDDDGFTQVLSLVIAIDVPDDAAKEQVTILAPRLKDAFIQEMYGELNRLAALKGGIVQVNIIKSRLNKIAHRVLGKDMVNDVLLQVVQQRPA